MVMTIGRFITIIKFHMTFFNFHMGLSLIPYLILPDPYPEMFLFPYGVSYGTLKYQVMGFSFRLYISICKFTGLIIEFIYILL